MLEFQTKVDERTGEEVVEVPLSGPALLDNPIFNKGSPPSPTTSGPSSASTGCSRRTSARSRSSSTAATATSSRSATELQQHVYLRDLQDRNEVLFYRLMLRPRRRDDAARSTRRWSARLPALQPDLPQAARAVRRYRAPRATSTRSWRTAPFREVDVIVVTDGERILGLGDRGSAAWASRSASSRSTPLCGGIHPARTLPIFLDVGTNNPEHLADPLYLGWRHERLAGQAYDDFIEAFVQAVDRALPARPAPVGRLRPAERPRGCWTGTATGSAPSTTTSRGRPPWPWPRSWRPAGRPATGSADQRVVILGAGSAGTRHRRPARAAMVAEGLSERRGARPALAASTGTACSTTDGRPAAVPAAARPAARTASRLGARRTAAIGLLEVIEQRPADGPDRHLGPAGDVHRGGRPAMAGTSTGRSSSRSRTRPRGARRRRPTCSPGPTAGPWSPPAARSRTSCTAGGRPRSPSATTPTSSPGWARA